jgi:hypothetical protein
MAVLLGPGLASGTQASASSRSKVLFVLTPSIHSAAAPGPVSSWHVQSLARRGRNHRLPIEDGPGDIDPDPIVATRQLDGRQLAVSDIALNCAR